MSGGKRRLSGKGLSLKDKEGRRLGVTLREFRPGDEEGMIACIRDEYGNTYFKQNFYRRKYLREEAESGHTIFLIAEAAQGEIAGMMALKQFYPKENMCEVASQIFRKKYRGYGLAEPFFEYGVEIMKGRGYFAAYSRPVLFHDVTQRLLYRQGFRATGFGLNAFNMDVITHSYENGKNEKHSYGIQILPLEKQNAGRLYVPKELFSVCSGIYDALGVSFRLVQEVEGRMQDRGLPNDSTVSYVQDILQKNLEIEVSKVGEDLPKRVEELKRKYPLTGRQTANLFLNINDPHAVWAYKKLKEAGYFFAGLKPLCSAQEYMVLHHRGEVEIHFEDYVLSGEFQKLLADCGCLKNGGSDEKREKHYI